MAITRQLTNGNKMTDWTEEVNDIANQYGAVNGMGLFSSQGISQTSIVFDKETNTTTLIPQTKRNAGAPTRGVDRKIETFSLSLPYFDHQDYVTPQDIQGHRMPGTPDQAETLGHVIAIKLEDMKLAADQTNEWMKISAIKGITVDTDGTILADMFDEFGTTRDVIDFDLGNAASDIDLHIAELKRTVAKNAKAGGRIGKIQVMVSPLFFDKLVNHPKIREAYLFYSVTNQRSDAVRADLARFETWGVVDTFEHKGILFWSYDAEFEIDQGDGTTATQVALGDVTFDGANAATGVGYTIVTGMRNVYRSYFGPANTLSGANAIAGDINLYQYTDPKDKFHELELEMSPLHLLMKPQLSLRVESST